MSVLFALAHVPVRLPALLVVTAFFGAPNVMAPALMTAALSLMVMLVVFLTLLLNCLFSSDVKIAPDSIVLLLVRMHADGPNA